MALPEQWHIKSRSRACSETGRSFEDGETICTALFRGEEEDGFARRDFSLEAWEGRPADAEPPFSVWRSVYQAPVTEEKPEVVRKENAEDLLKRLVEEDEEHTENVRYILAIMLERQKLLRETDHQRMPNGILRVYEHRKTGDVFLIKDPDIPLDQVESVQTEVLALLEHGGRRAGAGESQEDAGGESLESPTGPEVDEASGDPELPAGDSAAADDLDSAGEAEGSNSEAGSGANGGGKDDE